MITLNRRHVVLVTLGAAGALIVGWGVLPPRQRLLPGEPLATVPGQVALNGWVKLSTDDTVTVVMSQAEMGQGIHTGLAMLLADEMDADWSKVRLETSNFDKIYNNQAMIVDALPFAPEDHGLGKRVAQHLVRKVIREVPGVIATGGSSSMKDQWLPMRQAGASARRMLLSAAAALWRVPETECTADSGRVHHASGRSASYGELAGRAAGLAVPGDVALKQPSQFKLIGTAVRRLDAAAKLDGSAAFAIDASPPGLLYASIVMCPTLGGSVATLNSAAALALPGVHKAVVLAPIPGGMLSVGATSGGVAVIADTPFQAMRAIDSLVIDWDPGAGAAASTRAINAALTEAIGASGRQVHHENGDVDAAMQAAATRISADYQVPMLAHATMEPQNCTAQFKDGVATLWCATQAPPMARSAVASALKIDERHVQLHIPYLGGGFGRRYFPDVIVQAALLARETGGAPVQLLWTREQDMTHDYYRPAFKCRAQAGLDAQGRLIAWSTQSAGSSLGAPSMFDSSTDGASNMAYRFANARMSHQPSEAPVSLGIWRSVAHSQNGFFTESFIDECAVAAKRDPVEFRADLLRDAPRHLQVLHRAAELAHWGEAPGAAPSGAPLGRGIAIHRAFGSIVAQVADVSVDSSRAIRVHRVICVVDCGTAVNPNLIRQQMESAVVFGLSAALHGEITVKHGQVQQGNFDGYATLRFDECPAIETDIIASAQPPGGIGEAGTPPIAPAVANAVFALTGQRLRSLPLKLA
ncbi:MAG: molybdopterin cofactor-binding domain-containing protein [Steroidobacteraceae bacterium]